MILVVIPVLNVNSILTTNLVADNLDKQTGCIMQEDRNMKMSEKLENKKYTRFHL